MNKIGISVRFKVALTWLLTCWLPPVGLPTGCCQYCVAADMRARPVVLLIWPYSRESGLRYPHQDFRSHQLSPPPNPHSQAKKESVGQVAFALVSSTGPWWKMGNRLTPG